MSSRISSAREALARHEQQDPHAAGRVRQAVGGLLVADGLVGLERPLDGRRTRPGILGSAVGIVFAVGFLVVVRLLRGAFGGPGSVTSDPAFDDPFFSDSPASGLASGSDQVFDWAFTAMTVIGVLLLAAAVVTFLVRLASIVLGVVLLRSGGRMVAAHPAVDGAGVDAEVAAVREHLAGLLAGSSRSRTTARRRHQHLLDDDDRDDHGSGGRP